METAGGDDDTNVLCFPMCMEQAPLTWLDTLERRSIDKWEDLKKAFTSNFAGALGRANTKMDLARVKRKNGETLRTYMRRFFDKRATVVYVTDKEVIDSFQEGILDRQTYRAFGSRCSRSIPSLKTMVRVG